MLPRMYSKEPAIMDEFSRIIVDTKYDEDANYEEIVIGDEYISFTSRKKKEKKKKEDKETAHNSNHYNVCICDHMYSQLTYLPYDAKLLQ